MRWIARFVTALMAVLSLAAPAASSATAQTASAGTDSAVGSIQVAASCHYRVTGNDVAVRRAPDITAGVIKRKDRGDRVTGPCQNYYNGRWWTRVYLGSGGTGWMASAFLEYRGYW